MKVLLLFPLVLVLAACSSVNLPLSPYRIDVQQGNALEQESVDKLKIGLSRSQVRFLLGTPLLVDPFRGNRWDYVYNYRKAGKLTEKRRLVLYFEGDALARIESEGLSIKGEEAQPAEASSAQAVPAPAAAQLAPAALPEKAPAKAAAPAAATGASETSIVRPLAAEPGQPAKPAGRVVATETSTEAMALQPELNVQAIKPDARPGFPEAAAGTSREAVIAALNAWAQAWRSSDEQAYFAAYADSFRPAGGQTREEWEKRHRLLLGVSGKADLQIESVAVKIVSEDRAQASFRQFYRTGTYRDAVVKQLKFVRVSNRWMIEEENVLSTIKGGK